MSIATKRGDKGETSLIGNVRVSKGALRVEAYGTVDELISSMGFARSICEDAEVRERTKAIQRELFVVGSVLATAPDQSSHSEVTAEMIERLTDDVEREYRHWVQDEVQDSCALIEEKEYTVSEE